ncbi:hypothetical protein CAPTEDRAFT_192738, partial [Capitella teleta]
RMFKDHLVGGIRANLNPDDTKLASVPKSNKYAECVFGLLGHLITHKPDISTLANREESSQASAYRHPSEKVEALKAQLRFPNENLKLAIDDVFIKQLAITEAAYRDGLVSASADGASVNTGAYTGLLVRLKETRQWLVTIHCISHRIELAIKDSLLNTKVNKTASEIRDFLITLFYLFKKSPKISRHLKCTGDALEAQTFKFKKVHGT